MPPISWKLATCLLLVLVAGCSSSLGSDGSSRPGGKADQARLPAYMDPFDFLPNVDAWRYHSAVGALKAAFDQRCGDTWCEGDVSNLRAFDLVCSMRTDSTDTMRECTWFIVGTSSVVDENTGRVGITPTTSTCRMDVNGTVWGFMDEVEATTTPLETTVPGSDRRFYDVLRDCL